MTIITDHLARLAPASRGQGRLVAGSTATGAEISIPYIAARGAADGPTLWVTATVHGDEVNGTLAALDFVRHLDLAAMRGACVVIPAANPLAFDARAKTAPQDGLDIDQQFPGAAGGLTTQRVADRLWREIERAGDCLVSLHTLTAHFEAKPYGVYKLHPDGPVAEDVLLRHLSFYDPSVACLMPTVKAAGELPGNISGAIDYQFQALGKTAFMVELGAGSRIEWPYVEQGSAGLRRTAAEIGMFEDRPAPGGTLRKVLKRRHVTADTGGLFRAACTPGDILQPGSPLGVITDIFGDIVDTVTFAEPVLVIAARRDPVVATGDRIGFVATAWESRTLQSV
ncbi:M14 family metallopeptidase [Tistrella sp.]|uniref:M14 family metallopeptidase n=1 Tax=Tistrella sp. TaxID=2024861 RepID=UPI0025EAD095|nr:M14 family metallopeptidase [Tistrella sp.]